MTPRTTARARLSSVTDPSVVCVDLDGTLIVGDLFWESFVELVKRKPVRALLLLITAMWRGKAHLKGEVARQVPIDPRQLPYRAELLQYCSELRSCGAHLVLATAADAVYARCVADHVGYFAEVVASDGLTNNSGVRKAAALASRYGTGGFEYIGNSWADLPVWRTARAGAVVGASPRLNRRVQAEGLVQKATSVRPTMPTTLLKALRPHQWVKNLLVFLPLLASHQFLRVDLWAASAVTFAVFCLSASAVYLLNDINDIAADRQHRRKRSRPFAAGDLSIPTGVAVAGVLLLAALAVSALVVSPSLGLIVLAYVAGTSAYSLDLKRRAVADVFALTGLYVLRIIAGGVATGTALSSWLLAFALFFFLSLAFVKRYVELIDTNGWILGRGYGPDDVMWMHAIGTTAGYMAVLVLALYVTAPDVSVMYRRPQALWLLCPVLLFWLTRLWFRANRRAIHDDPVVEAVRDPMSYAVCGLAAAIVLTAL
jgi:4-hydroxybenzoate polyprenyltransferase